MKIFLLFAFDILIMLEQGVVMYIHTHSSFVLNLNGVGELQNKHRKLPQRKGSTICCIWVAFALAGRAGERAGVATWRIRDKQRSRAPAAKVH